VAGQVAGGLLVGAHLLGTGWRPTLLLDVATGAALWAIAWRALPPDRVQPAHRRVDLTGALLLPAALLLLVVPLTLGRDAGWPWWTWASLGTTIPALVFFVRSEGRIAERGGRPVMDPRWLARPAIAWGAASVAAAAATYFATLFVLALYLQQGLGTTPAYSGWAMTPWVAAFGVAGPILARLPAHRRPTAGPLGGVLLAAGFVGIALRVSAGHPAGPPLVGLLGLAGLGFGTSFSGLLAHLTATVSPGYGADISGLINTASRLGGVLGVAVFGTLYVRLVGAGGAPLIEHGFVVVCLVLAGVAVGAAVTAQLSIQTGAPARGGDHRA
jgi:hypothetical protein